MTCFSLSLVDIVRTYLLQIKAQYYNCCVILYVMCLSCDKVNAHNAEEVMCSSCDKVNMLIIRRSDKKHSMNKITYAFFEAIIADQLAFHDSLYSKL